MRYEKATRRVLVLQPTDPSLVCLCTVRRDVSVEGYTEDAYFVSVEDANKVVDSPLNPSTLEYELQLGKSLGEALLVAGYVER